MQNGSLRAAPTQSSHLFRRNEGLGTLTRLTIGALTLNSLTIARQGGSYSAMLMLVPLNEIVTLTITYEVLTPEFETTFIRSPFSRTMTLRAAVTAALNCRTAKASIIARGITYRNPDTFRRIWMRREFFQAAP